MLLRRFADEISVDFAGWDLSHSKVVSRDRESLSNVSQMTDCLLETLSPEPQVSTASDTRGPGRYYCPAAPRWPGSRPQPRRPPQWGCR